jgi:tetratricopeptide (TPR) repeat protein
MAKKRYSHKQIRKSIKQDELRNALTRIIEFSKKNTENILISAIIFIVILVLIPLYFNNRAKNEERAGGLLNRAMNYSMQPIAGAYADPNSGAFRTLDEKYKKVQSSFNEITGTYRNTRAAQIAKVGEANASFYLKEYDKAIGLYQDAKLKQSDVQLKLTLDERIAASQSNLQKWQAALDVYQFILSEAPDYFNKRSVRLQMARCYTNLNQNEKAKAILEVEKNEDPGSYWSEIARRQMLEPAETKK